MNPLAVSQAAKAIKSYLVREYAGIDQAKDVLTWNAKDVAYYGWGSADGQVCWEGGPYDWPQIVSNAIYEGDIKLPDGVFVEPFNSFITSLYKDPGNGNLTKAYFDAKETAA